MSTVESRAAWLDGPPGGGEFGGRLDPDSRHDVVVVGAGIVGATVAWELARRGAEVLVLDVGPAAVGVTGQSTGKVTTGTGSWLLDVRRTHGMAAAVEFATAAAAALAFVRARGEHLPGVADHDHDLYATTPTAQHRLEELAPLTMACGPAAVWVHEPPGALPPGAGRALRFPHQVLVDPVGYVRALLADAARRGATVRTGARVVAVDGSGPVRVLTDDMAVVADDVVLATHTPFPKRTLAFASTRMVRHYAVAGFVADQIPCTFDIGNGWSTRPLPPTTDGRLRAMAVGSSHVTGHGDPVTASHRLRLWAAGILGMDVVHAWSSQDARSADGLPIVGRAPLDAHLWIATGFDAWGLTLGTAAALDLARQLDGSRTRVPSWRPRRPSLLLHPAVPLAAARDTVAGVLPRLGRARIGARPEPAPPDVLDVLADLPPGQGRVVVTQDGGELAVAKDGDGRGHLVASRCTHLGCRVTWNAEAASWDCGCHGSRFAADGRVLHGPALDPLRPCGPAGQEPAAAVTAEESR